MKHAPNWNGDDRTLCGLANDVGDCGLEPLNPEYAKVGQQVTCLDCRSVVKHVRACFPNRTYQLESPARESPSPRRNKTSVSGTNYIVHIMGAFGLTFCGRRNLSVNCIRFEEVGASPESECRSCQAALARTKESVLARKQS